MTTVLGIDPGSVITGYGVIQQTGCTLSYVGSGCIYTRVKNFFSRLKLIYEGITDIISTFHPDCFSIEQVFISKNFNSALKLGQARGTAIIAALNQDLPIFEYTACQVKQAVVGIGRAEKSQVQYMVSMLLKIPTNLKKDASDALAIAITHCHTNKYVR